MPLMKMTEQVLASGALDDLAETDAEFGLALFAAIKNEMSRSRDPFKLMTGADA